MREADDKQRRVLIDIKTTAEGLQLPILVVGAGARIFIFDRQYNVEGRVTSDLDFAVQVDSWSDYQLLRAEMTQGTNPNFRVTSIQHKFIHISTGIEVDIVPFGVIGQPNQLLRWSDDNQMNLLGFDEALLTAITLVIDGVEIKVVNLPALLVLKLIAWSDRQAMKDLQDINFILKNFSDDNRIFEELLDELSQGLTEYENASAFLLGRDIARTFNEATIREVEKILSQLLENRNRFFSRLISSRDYEGKEWDAEFDNAVRRFQALQEGVCGRK
jgi:predicted nucleotidyltransferase